MTDVLDTHLSQADIIERAKNKWNQRSSDDKIKCSTKYRHIFTKIGFQPKTWDADFLDLDSKQKNILIKGELIRTYDSLSNKVKTKLKEECGLTTFASKWFRLPSCDKKKLLMEIIR